MKKARIIILAIVVVAALAAVKYHNGNRHEQTAGENSGAASPQGTADAPAAAAETESGKIADFSLPDTNGNSVSVMSEISRSPITIIDFWASWCGPCVNEMPNLKAIHSKYPDVGIIGISLDEDKGKWLHAIGTLGLDWLHLSDLQGWDNKAARLFEVNSIPYTIVVSQDGTILATGLRGEQLKSFIEKMKNEK